MIDDGYTVACPTCEAKNTRFVGALGPTYRCEDCGSNFGLDGGPME